MEELKISYKFNLEDFKIMENIEHSYFTNDNISPANEVLRWYEKNNLTCIALRNANSEVIASVNILPLKKEVFDKIYNNQMNEADVVDNQIEEYKDNKSYSIYLSSISIHEKYRNNYKVIITLLKGCINMFDKLSKRNIQIKEVMADASTIHGEKLCKRLLKMNYVRETSHQTKIYYINGEKFMKTMQYLKSKI